MKKSTWFNSIASFTVFDLFEYQNLLIDILAANFRFCEIPSFSSRWSSFHVEPVSSTALNEPDQEFMEPEIPKSGQQHSHKAISMSFVGPNAPFFYYFSNLSNFVVVLQATTTAFDDDGILGFKRHKKRGI